MSTTSSLSFASACRLLDNDFSPLLDASKHLSDEQADATPSIFDRQLLDTFSVCKFDS